MRARARAGDGRGRERGREREAERQADRKGREELLHHLPEPQRNCFGAPLLQTEPIQAFIEARGAQTVRERGGREGLESCRCNRIAAADALSWLLQRPTRARAQENMETAWIPGPSVGSRFRILWVIILRNLVSRSCATFSVANQHGSLAHGGLHAGGDASCYADPLEAR